MSHDRSLCTNCRNEEYATFRHACVHESMDKNKLWMAKFGIGSWPRWDYSMDEATLIFSSEGVEKVICDMQVVGTTQGDSWEWAWGNRNLPEICRWRMQEVHDFGKEKEWVRLTTLFLANDEYLGWECTAIANHLFQGVGVYRCPNSDKDGAVWVVILSCNFVN